MLKAKLLKMMLVALVVLALLSPQVAFATRSHVKLSNLVVAEGQNVTQALASHHRHHHVGDVKYPMYKQCDPSWGKDLIYTKTVCQVGCLMSSISMGLHGWSLNLDGKPSNPGTLNAWLKANNGYTHSNNLVESALNQAFDDMWIASGMHKTNDLTPYELQSLIQSDKFVLANVHKGRHFVLVTNWDEKNPDVVWVNDPGFNTEYYSFSKDVVGWRVFDVNSHALKHALLSEA